MEEPKEITRGQQTAWIVGAIIAVGLAALWFAMRLPEGHPYAECQNIIGIVNKSCSAMIAASELARGY